MVRCKAFCILFLSVSLSMLSGGYIYAQTDSQSGQDATATHPWMEHRISKIFDKMDTNHDGKISEDEWTSFEQKRFGKIDTDQNGVITQDELAANFQKMKGKFGGGHDKPGHSPLFGLLHKLDLTEQQKAQLAAILRSNEDEEKSVATQLASARAQLAKAILSGGDVSAASHKVATYAEQAAQLQSKIVAQMTAILTTEQKSTLQGIHDKIGSNADKMIQKRFARLDEWIAKHSQ